MRRAYPADPFRVVGVLPRRAEVFIGAPVARLGTWFAVLLSLALCVTALARVRQESVDLLGSLPGSVHAAILVEDASSLRGAPAGKALERLFQSAGLLSETSEAWKQLAATLDVPPDHAFDALVGRSLLVVIEFEPSDAEPGCVDTRWAVMSRIDAGFEKRLSARLRPAPRGVSGGRPVLSLENGRFELATVDTSREKPGSDGVRRATAILAPASSSALFDRLVSGQGGGRLSEVPGFEYVTRMGDRPIIALLRGPLPGKYASPESLKEAPSILAFGMRAAGDTRWEASIAGNPALMTASRPPGGMASLTLPRAGIRQIAPDSMFVFAGPTDGVGFSKLPGPIGEQLSKLTGPTQELDALLGPRMLMWMHPADGASGFSMSVGVQVSDVARASELGDAVLARLLRDHACPTGPDGGRLSKELSFEGLGPEAQRTVELRAADQVVREGQERAFMAWSYENSGPGPEGWWIASLARGGSTRAANAEIERLRIIAGAPAEAERDVFSVVRLRPSAFVKLAGPAVAMIPVLSSMSQVDSVGWEVFLNQDGEASGSAWLEFTKPVGPIEHQPGQAEPVEPGQKPGGPASPER